MVDTSLQVHTITRPTVTENKDKLLLYPHLPTASTQTNEFDVVASDTLWFQSPFLKGLFGSA